MSQPNYFGNQRVWALSDVARAAKRAIEERCVQELYVQAEIAKLNHFTYSGHCYPDLVEKKDGKVVAQFRGVIWKSSYDRITKRFLELTGEELRAGMSILCLAKVRYDMEYGISLQISDVVPEFSLGEMARLRQETIRRLRSEGLFDANKRHALPLLPRHIAVISVETSNGYADFLKELSRSKFPPQTYLFAAILQGNGAIAAIGDQLSRIAALKDNFDAVVIVRGGGGDVGLSAYDHYDLARSVAACPLPVLAGIGHAENVTVVDMVAFQTFITPTAVGTFLVGKIQAFAEAILGAQRRVVASAEARLSKAGDAVRLCGRALTNASARSVVQGKNALENFSHRFENKVHTLTGAQHDQLRLMAEKVRLLDPQKILQRGYSMTLKNGKIVADSRSLAAGDVLESVFAAGRVHSQVLED
jgi:exodeoxyribonuclease VII large subunit